MNDGPLARSRAQAHPLKNKLRALYRKGQRLSVRLWGSYGRVELVRAIRKLGVESGDAIMLHSAFQPEHGFRGSSSDVVDAFLEVLGPQGHLLMVSLPYRSSSLEYLCKGRVFDLRRTPSAMGLVSEFFRRRDGVLRSLHPTHPVLVYGPRAAWFVEGHEHSLYPCGPETPFGRLLECGGKAVFFNVPFVFLTFFHYLEHVVSPRLGFPLYTEEPFEVPVIDGSGLRGTVTTHVFSPEAIKRRRFPVLESWLRGRGTIRRVKVGASYLLAADLREIANTVEEMAARGEYFYDLDETDGRTRSLR